LGNGPWPQRLKEPKSLDQYPCGTSGRFDPEAKLIEIRDADGAITHALD
jgi:hypothetical protein